MTAKPFPISSSKTPEHAASPETRGPIRSSTIPARSGRTYRLFTLHHQNARLLLHPPVHQHGAFIYDLGFRRDLITNKDLIEAIDLLYWDTKRHRPKRGATTTTRPAASSPSSSNSTSTTTSTACAPTRSCNCSRRNSTRGGHRRC